MGATAAAAGAGAPNDSLPSTATFHCRLAQAMWTWSAWQRRKAEMRTRMSRGTSPHARSAVTAAASAARGGGEVHSCRRGEPASFLCHSRFCHLQGTWGGMQPLRRRRGEPLLLHPSRSKPALNPRNVRSRNGCRQACGCRCNL